MVRPPTAPLRYYRRESFPWVRVCDAAEAVAAVAVDDGDIVGSGSAGDGDVAMHVNARVYGRPPPSVGGCEQQRPEGVWAGKSYPV